MADIMFMPDPDECHDTSCQYYDCINCCCDAFDLSICQRWEDELNESEDF